jgi:hypothetical protein
MNGERLANDVTAYSVATPGCCDIDQCLKGAVKHGNYYNVAPIPRTWRSFYSPYLFTAVLVATVRFRRVKKSCGN